MLGQNAIEQRSKDKNTIERKTTGQNAVKIMLWNKMNGGQQHKMLSNKDQKISTILNGRQQDRMLSNKFKNIRIKLKGGQQVRMLSNEHQKIRVRLNGGQQDRILSNKY